MTLTIPARHVRIGDRVTHARGEMSVTGIDTAITTTAPFYGYHGIGQ